MKDEIIGNIFRGVELLQLKTLRHSTKAIGICQVEQDSKGQAESFIIINRL